jgi:hypothetical protein
VSSTAFRAANIGTGSSAAGFVVAGESANWRH